MKPLARISAIYVVGLGLGTATSAFGQIEEKAGTINAPSGRQSAGTAAGAVQPSDAAPSHEPAATVRSETALPIASSSTERNSVGGGYSWTDKKSRPRKHKKLTTLDPSRPLVQAPNFAMRPDGSSVVSLAFSQTTQVTRVIGGDRVEYRVKDAQIGVYNNMNPLVTAHFATPVERVAMLRTKEGASLILDLRERIQPMHQVHNGPAGGMVLEITLPKPSRAYPPPQTQQPSRSLAGTPDGSDPEQKAKRRTGTAKHQAAKSGPGPRL